MSLPKETLAATSGELTDTTRANYVLLITDGMENCGGAPVAEVEGLFSRGVRTYSVGFGRPAGGAFTVDTGRYTRCGRPFTAVSVHATSPTSAGGSRFATRSVFHW